MKPLLAIKALAKVNYVGLSKEFLFFVRFFVLVILFLFFDLLKIISHLPVVSLLVKPFKKVVKNSCDRTLSIFNSRSEGEIASLDLVKLAVSHLLAKKVRTMITIGGMAIGFGSVIFLLSLGYGTQKLVVSRVARLGEMKQINVTVGQASSLAMNEQSIEEFKKLENVEAVIPLVSVVSKVNYNNSISDAVSYGVTKRYLEESAIQPSLGRLFDDGDISDIRPSSNTGGIVAGAQNEAIYGAKMYSQVSSIRYSLFPLEWKAVYKAPSQDSEIIGYTTRTVGELDATEVWGKPYLGVTNLIEGVDAFGNVYTPWIKDTFPLWKKEVCSTEQFDCKDGNYRLLKNGPAQQLSEGYITTQNTNINRYKITSESAPELKEGEVVEEIEFSLPRGVWLPTHSDAVRSTQDLGLFTTESTTGQLITGELVYGESYGGENGWGRVGENANGQQLGYWVRAKVPLWRKVDCEDCANLYLKEVDAQDQQVEAYSFVRADQLTIEGLELPPRLGSVLGIATESGTLASNNTSSDSAAVAATFEEPSEILLGDGTLLQPTTLEDGSVDWVTIASGSAGVGGVEKRILPFPDSSKKEVVVNTALLKVFGIPESEALGKTFTTTFILDAEFFEEGATSAESEPVELSIIGIIPDERTPSFYLPFSDLKQLGVQNYSQVKIIVEDQNDLKIVRQTIESLGYKTASVVDTVSRINSLFDTIRLLLSLLGFVALSVAALGMFNTLTVSLLEKTREVGLMKAIGMKSNEVKRLFLAESIVMGLSGGIFGLVLSIILGNLLSFILSLISVTKGQGYINIVHIPIALGVGIVALSFIIGVVTGMYPSHRATKISALNALRYE